MVENLKSVVRRLWAKRRSSPQEGNAQSAHASLDATFTIPELLEPRRSMGRNETCWCGSGNKWKRCHRLREKAPRVNSGALHARMHQEFNEGFCSHPEADTETCGERIVRAHTVQRQGGLAAIAEDGHVISVESAARDLHRNEGRFVPRQVGVRSASTFMGFCNRHDTEMFRTVETGEVRLNPRACFLLGFRAIAYEYYMKALQRRVIGLMRRTDAGLSFEEQCTIQQVAHAFEVGVLRGIEDGTRWKRQYDTMFRAERLDDHRFVAVEYSGILPVVGCGAFHPEFDFGGNALQRIGHGDAHLEHLTFNLTVLNDRSVMVLGWTEGTQGPAEAFARSFRNLSDRRKLNASVQLAFEHMSNVFMKPSWWRNLPNAVSTALVRRMHSGSGLGGHGRSQECLQPDGHDYTHRINVVNVLTP